MTPLQALLDAHAAAAVDARACGGDFGSADRFAEAEHAVEALFELQRIAAAKLVNDALALQHEKINRMESALQEIQRAAQNAWPAIADIAAAGLK